jgi:hypothetical protein
MAFDSEHPEDQGTTPTSGGAQAIPPIDGTLVAFIGRAQRGPVNRAVVVDSYEEFRRVFGGNTAFSHLSHVVLHFFQNGGQHAAVVRVINRGRRASLSLPTSSSPLKLRARHPGSHELIRVSIDHDEWSLYPSRFNLTIQRVARQGAQLVEDQEIFRGLSVEGSDQSYFVDVLSNSSLVTVEGPLPDSRPRRTVSTSVGEAVSYLPMEADGHDGDELTDYDVIGSRDQAAGLFALERLARFDLLCIPPPPSGRDVGVTSLVAAERYCAERHATLIVDPPASWQSADTALLNARRVNFSSPHALGYFPRIKPRVGAERFPNGLPGCGAVAGILARKDGREGMWAATTESNALLRGHVGAACEINSQQAALLQRQGFNTFSRSPNGTPSLAGDVTLVVQGAVAGWQRSLACQRFVARVIAEVIEGTAFARGASNESSVQRKLVSVASFFLLDLYERGALLGQSPAEAFFVRSLSGADCGLLLGLALERPGDFKAFEIIQGQAGARSRIVELSEALQHAQ